MRDNIDDSCRGPIQRLDDTGERMIPESAHKGIFWEHIHRYQFATRFVRKKRVLDIACGEGYGAAALLRSGATQVIGIDLDEDVCKYARAKYGIDTRQGDAESIPLPDSSVDVVVSFETIEHLAHQKIFLDECYRVLTKGGVLVVSTPNRDVFRETRDRTNPFHSFELDKDQFCQLLDRSFSKYTLFCQCPQTIRWWSIYTLADRNSPWLKVRGFWWFRELLREWSNLRLWTELDSGLRLSSDRLILKEGNLIAKLVNPYRVMKWSQTSFQDPVYLVGVVHK